MKFSIIVPVYNSSLYLRECLNSLRNQTFKNIEVILVNDGSTDNSQQICEEFVSCDDRFFLFNNSNHGVSFSRNFGISKSTGDYLMFVDSDDYLLNNTLECVVDRCVDNDLVIFGYSEVYKNRILSKVQEFDITDYQEIYKKIILSNLGGFLCNKVFRRDLIINNNLKLDESITYCEDLLFTIKYLAFCDNCYYICTPFYQYRMRKSGVSWSFYKEKNISIFKAYNEVLCLVNNLDCINHLKINYVFNYYRLCNFIPRNCDFIDYEIIDSYLNNEIEIGLGMKVKIFICKNNLNLFKVFQRIKQVKFKLFD